MANRGEAAQAGHRSATAWRLWIGWVFGLSVVLAAGQVLSSRNAVSDWIGYRLLQPLEWRHARAAPRPAIKAILVPGGNIERTREGIRMAYQHPAAALVVLGDDHRNLAVLQSEVAIADRVVVEANSRTTFENAGAAKALLQPRPGETYLLISSARHLPRAVGTFRRAGFEVHPWPVGAGMSTWMPLRAAAYEYAALTWYWLSGKSDALFPKA